MKKQRDDIFANDPLYEGETLQTVAVEHLHDLCRQAIDRCKRVIEPLGQRFINLKSQSPLQRREEVTWLVDSLDTWFTKKWNDKRGADARRIESPRKKKAVFCIQCRKALHCLDCDGIGPKVFPPLMSSSNVEQLEKMDLESAEAATQTDSPVVADKAVQTDTDLGSKENPFLLDDDLYNPHDAVSDEEDADDMTETEPPRPANDDKFFFGTAFEKVEEFDHHLDDPNPWHPDLNRPLFPSQIIGFRWMASRHARGGGLVGDKVGCGKVLSQSLRVNLIIDLSSHQLHSLAPNDY